VGAFKLTTGEQVWRFNLIRMTASLGPIHGETLKRDSTRWQPLDPLALDVAKGILYLRLEISSDFNGAVRRATTCIPIRWSRSMCTRQAAVVPPVHSNDTHDSDLSQVSPLFTAKIAANHAT